MSACAGGLGPTLVTGGARRLGKATAERLAAGGTPVVIHANASRTEAEALAGAIRAAGGQAGVAVADLADEAALDRLVESAAEAIGAPIRNLVNCAAIFEHDRLESFNPDLLRAHASVNVVAPLRLMQRFSGALPEGARGAVVNFLDFKLASPYPDHLSYTLSKYALSGATDMLARQLAPRVRVNAVAPGYVLPSPGQDEADFARLHRQNPLELGATAEHIAAAVEFLLATPSITGQTIYVDSGLRFLCHDQDFAFR